MISIKVILIMACIAIISVVAHGPRDDKRRPWDPSMTRPPKPTLAPGETYPPRRGRGGHDSHDKDFTRPTLAPGETYPPRRHPPFRGGGGRDKFTRDKDFTKPTLAPGETYPPRGGPPHRGPPHRGPPHRG